MKEAALPQSDNRIRTRWAGGEAAVLGWLQIPSALSAEALAHCGFDGLVVDLQHSPIDIANAAAMFTAIEAGGAEPMARVACNDAAEIGRLLDAGAYGIIVPAIETAEQVAAMAEAIHYPPVGLRSYGPRRPLLRYGAAYHSLVAQAAISFAMIETRAGLDNLDAILSAPGIDGVFIGPADLALSLGAAPVADSEDAHVVAAVRHIRERAHAHGRRAGIFCRDPGFASARIAEGFDFVSVAPDLALLMETSREAVKSVRDLVDWRIWERANA